MTTQASSKVEIVAKSSRIDRPSENLSDSQANARTLSVLELSIAQMKASIK